MGRTGLSPVMVGRAAELDRLAALVDARPAPSVALVAGEAGIGKTRLVQELVAAMPAGTFVLAGQADPGTSGRPLDLVLDALRDAPTEAHADLLAAAGDRDRPADERVQAAVELVRRLAEGRRGLVVFEDLHWADPESVRVFEYLAEPEGGPLLVVGTYRPDALSRRHPAAEMLPRLDRRHRVTHVRLSRLSAADVDSFLTAVHGGSPTYRTVEALHSRTGGHPFFLEELVASAGEAGDEGLDAMPLPWTVAELVRSQLDDLAPDVRQMVTAAAVLGRRVPFDVLAAVTGTTEDELIPRLRAAIDAGLLIEAEPDIFGFHHELAREAIEDTLLGRERRRLHEAALATLKAAGSRDHVAIVHHARAAGRYEDMVQEAREGARESLALGSSYQALQLAEAGLTEAEEDIDLLRSAARAAWLVDFLDDAVDYADRWLHLVRGRGDASGEAQALALRTRVAFERGDVEAMVRFTDDLEGALPRLDEPDQARAMAAIAQSYMLREQADATVEWADRAIALAEAHGLDDVRVAATVEKSSLLIHTSRASPAAWEMLEQAAEEAERTGDHVMAARAFNNLLWHARRWRGAEEVRALIDRAMAHASAGGFDSPAVADRPSALAQLAAEEGDLAAARAHLDVLDDPGSGLRSSWTRGRFAAVIRAGLALEADDLEAAARHTEEAKPVTERTAPGVFGLELNLAARQRRPEAARELLVPLLKVVADEGSASPAQAHDVISAALSGGLTPDELRPLVDMVGYYVGHRLPDDDPWKLLLEAQLAEAEGRIAEAAEGYVVAAGGLRDALHVLAGQRGTAHVRAARTLIALGRVDEARVHAREAAGHLARWDGWRSAELRAVERRLGLGDEPAGPASLTPREREVAALLAEGLSNAALAERLFISPRTAAVHVSNILAKLGMGSRTEVAAWAASGGLSEG